MCHFVLYEMNMFWCILNCQIVFYIHIVSNQFDIDWFS